MNKLLVLLIFLPNICLAVGEEESILELKSSKRKGWSFGPKIEQKESVKKPRKTFRSGNLPYMLVRKKGSIGGGAESKPIKFPELAKLNKTGMDVGDIFDCIIEQDIKAYAGSISPIKATILNGKYEGLVFVGNATMDPKTKDIVIEFNTIRDTDSNLKHSLKATLHSSTGQLGLKGTFHSKYWQYFFATVMARTAEGYAQATVDRDRNVFGMYQQKPNPSNAGKAAVAEAASSTANQLAERVRNLPEYVTKRGPIKTKVFIMKTPELIN